MKNVSIVILAAGHGKRMHSSYPKVLHMLGGKSLLRRVVETAEKLHPQRIIIVHGFQGEMVQAHLENKASLSFVKQESLLGTGHAVLQALPLLPKDDQVLILYGDVPLLTLETLQTFLKEVPEEAVGMMTAVLENPTGFGRIIRDVDGKVFNVVEEKDATMLQKAIHEINTGILVVPAKYLHQWLPKLKATNAQNEYYLPDIISMAYQEKVQVVTVHPKHLWETQGINDKIQLAEMERILQKNEADRLLAKGVTVLDPNRLDVRGEVTVGKDVTLDVNVILEGTVVLEDGVTIGAHTWIKDCVIKKGSVVKPYSVLEEAMIGENCIVGPFARLRPGTELDNHARIGNFVEVKNAFIGKHSKINHLSYIGDARLGQKVNIGAGTITCNYNGVKKSLTIIEDNAFIGSNTLCIAPVQIGKGATIGAGTVVTKDAPSGQLTVGRAPQRIIPDWKDPRQEALNAHMTTEKSE